MYKSLIRLSEQSHLKINLKEVGQTASERSAIVDRVFHIKLKEFMRDIRERGYFGKTLASNILY